MTRAREVKVECSYFFPFSVACVLVLNDLMVVVRPLLG